MILQSYYELAAAIRAVIPEWGWIDWDKGQLDNPENFNSLTTPGVLIGFSEIIWETFGARQQIGSGHVTIKLVVVLPAQTHDTDPLAASNLEPLTLATDISTAVGTVGFTRPRSASSDYPVLTWYVMEQVFPVQLTPDPPNYKRITVPVKLNIQLTNPIVPQ